LGIPSIWFLPPTGVSPVGGFYFNKVFNFTKEFPREAIPILYYSICKGVLL
jgi:hypothetical protein